MGKTSDLTVVQKTIIDTLHKERKTQKVIAERAGCSQSTVSSKADSRTWESFTMCGLRLGSVHQEPPCTDVFGKRDRTAAFLVSSHS